MNGLEAEFAGRLAVVRLDVGQPENGRIQQSYNMRGHPSVVIIDAEGQPTERYFGAEDVETLRTAINQVIPSLLTK